MSYAADTERFRRALRSVSDRVFRLETLQVYRGSGEDSWIEAFERGDAAPPPLAEQAEWEQMLSEHRAAGRTWQRVHVVTEPLTDYMRFELTWAYAPNVAAGEDIRVVPVGRGRGRGRRWPSGVPYLDFWRIDGQRFDGVYAPDGTWLGVRYVPDPGPASLWEDAALTASIPWRQFIAGRPDLEARLPRG